MRLEPSDVCVGVGGGRGETPRSEGNTTLLVGR